MTYDPSWLDKQPPRLGDLIDDFCPRCKHLLNHAIASFVDNKVVKVICQTCYTEHAYMEGQDKKKAAKAAKAASSAFEQVLSKVAPVSGAAVPAAPKKAKPRARYISRRQPKTPKNKK